MINDQNKDNLTSLIIQCIIKIHSTLGPGFREVIYSRALIIELKKNNFHVESEKSVKIYYEEHHIGSHRIDLIVNNNVIIELKTVEALNPSHYAQLKSYMRASGINVGILVNFSGDKADFRRVDRR